MGGIHRASVDARDNDVLPLDLLLAKLLLVPLATRDGAREHGEDLIEKEAPRGGAGDARGNPEPEPLDPLHEVVRVEHVSEQAVVGDFVVLLDVGVTLLL